MKYTFDYDKTNPKSIEDYAQRLIGHTFNEVGLRFYELYE